MSRPNLVLELSILKGLNQIRRNIGRVSSSYLDVRELTQLTLELTPGQSQTLPACSTLVLKTSGSLYGILTTSDSLGVSSSVELQVNQLLVLDSPIDQLELTNTGSENIQVIVILCK